MGLRMFCALGPIGPALAGIVLPLVPFSPPNVLILITIFGLVYGINKDFNILNKKNGKRNLGISIRNSIFVYFPCMCLLIMCLARTACRAVG